MRARGALGALAPSSRLESVSASFSLCELLITATCASAYAPTPAGARLLSPSRPVSPKKRSSTPRQCSEDGDYAALYVFSRAAVVMLAASRTPAVPHTRTAPRMLAALPLVLRSHLRLVIVCDP